MKINGQHRHIGFCPDAITGKHSRDCDCEACIALVFAEHAKLNIVIDGMDREIGFSEFKAHVKKSAKRCFSGSEIETHEMNAFWDNVESDIPNKAEKVQL